MEAYHKAQVLIEALPYFKAFDEKIFVVKIGGNAMHESSLFDTTLEDIVFMEQVGIRPVVVHGGGPYISDRLQKNGVQTKFIDGLRVTDKATLDTVDEVFKEINTSIRNTIVDKGGRAISLHGANDGILFSKKKKIKDKPGVDLGFVGELTGVDANLILQETRAGTVPVISPLARGVDGEFYNINADTAAAKIAEVLRAEKLVFMSNIKGLLADPSNPDSLLSTLTPNEVKDLIAKGVITGGMLPKVEASLHALEAGVHAVHIVDGRQHHSLLLEIFTQRGIGTQFVKNA